MAPAIGGGARREREPSPKTAFEAFAREAKRYIAETHDYVGGDFAHEARAMYYGEIDERPIWGQATAAEAEELAKEGVKAAPLPARFAPAPPKPTGELN